MKAVRGYISGPLSNRLTPHTDAISCFTISLDVFPFHDYS